MHHKLRAVIGCLGNAVSPGRRGYDAKAGHCRRASGDAGEVGRGAGGSCQNPISGHQREVQLSEGEGQGGFTLQLLL